MKFEVSGVEITVEFDGDGFPLVAIQTNGYTAEHDRPAIQVELNGVTVHEMFDHGDEGMYDDRWDRPFAA